MTVEMYLLVGGVSIISFLVGHAIGKKAGWKEHELLGQQQNAMQTWINLMKGGGQDAPQ